MERFRPPCGLFQLHPKDAQLVAAMWGALTDAKAGRQEVEGKIYHVKQAILSSAAPQRTNHEA